MQVGDLCAEKTIESSKTIAKPVLELRIDKGFVFEVAISRDGKLLAAAAGGRNYGTVYVWHLETGKLHSAFRGHNEYVYSVAFSPDGKLLASAGADQTVRLWNLANRKIVATMKGHSNDVKAVAFSPDGALLASAAWDKTIRLWDARTGEKRATLTVPGKVDDIAFSKDGKTLVSNGQYHSLLFWDVAKRKVRTTINGDKFGGDSLALSPDGRTLASTSMLYGHVRFWDMETGRLKLKLTVGDNPTGDVAFSGDDKFLSFGVFETALVYGWDGRRAKLQATITRAHRSMVTSTAFSPDGKLLVTGGWDEFVRVWRLSR
jgi:WD40 repeat protein